MMQKFGRDDDLIQSLQELFPSSSAEEKVDKVLVLTEAYHNYKRDYVKRRENLSKFTRFFED